MDVIDKDLVSIQEARRLAITARDAQRIWGKASQVDVDRVCATMAEAAFRASERLGKLANEETGYGVPAHKKIKNEFGSRGVWESIKDIKTVGVIDHDPTRKIYEIAWPMGVVAALTPSTNPTSTAMAKILFAVKARDAIVIAPHPSAIRCSNETCQIMAKAAEEAGAPHGLVSCMQNITLAGTQELMNHHYVALILATGGSAMVKAAHSVGKPAYGVGPGNVPVYVDRSADLEKAARYIVSSKSFDYSTICSSEQAVVADRPIAKRLAELMQAEGAYFVDEIQANALSKTLFFPDGSINSISVGKSPQYLAGMAGFQIPGSARIMVARLNEVGKNEPLSREKLTTVLGWYEADGWEAGCDRCIELIQFGGRGHTQIIHAKDDQVILSFGLEKPVFRIVVNTMGTLGAIGFTTGLMPSLTLGSGGIGGSITGDNITVYHLFNIKRMAYELKPPPEIVFRPSELPAGPTPQEIEKVVQAVVSEILNIR
ncbi:MAG TPA: aldehyde dehydrogenase family protein [Anaerolineaceae bacterium]|nr:aldehyde dehydrogenase family protein [Anaerolineaceae bacterium]